MSNKKYIDFHNKHMTKEQLLKENHKLREKLDRQRVFIKQMDKYSEEFNSMYKFLRESYLK